MTEWDNNTVRMIKRDYVTLEDSIDVNINLNVLRKKFIMLLNLKKYKVLLINSFILM